MPFRLSTIQLATPEIVLIATAVVIVVGGAFWRSRSAWTLLAIIGVFAAGLLIASDPQAYAHPAFETIEGPWLVDSLALHGRLAAMIIGGLLLLLLGDRAAELQGGELPGLVLVMTAGLSLACWSGNLILLFLASETVTIPTYVLLFAARNSRDCGEATVKYFLLSVVSSVGMLLGFTLLFGLFGTMSLPEIAAQAGAKDFTGQTVTFLLAGTMIFAGLGFKLAAVPLHFYAPDVYQLTTNPMFGLISVVPKIAGVVILARILSAAPQIGAILGWPILIVLSIASMSLGNLAALAQGHIRRMLAYSSIAHAGYLLIGFAVAAAEGPGGSAGLDGFTSAFLYLFVYSLASITAASCLAAASVDGREANTVEDIRGLFFRRPFLAMMLAVAMFALAGLPPLAGFWGKFALLGGAVEVATSASSSDRQIGFAILAVVAMINAAIAATYYLRLVASAFFYDTRGIERARETRNGVGNGIPRDPNRRFTRPAAAEEKRFTPVLLAAFLSSILLITFGLYPGPIAGRAREAGRSLLALPAATADPASGPKVASEKDTMPVVKRPPI